MRESGLGRRQRLAMLWSARTRLERLAALHRGRRLFKWRHYYEVYDRHLARLRGRRLKLLEIGIGHGGSLQLWRRYFGARARIIGVDIREECRQFAGRNIVIEIGSQGDPEFLRGVAERHGPFDVVIEDGSHQYADQLITLRTMLPHLVPDGVYSCEDLCTSYWEQEFGGGLRAPHSTIEHLKGFIDELNAWFWRDGVENEEGALARSLHSLHFYPTLAVIEKRAMAPPVVLHIGPDP